MGGHGAPRPLGLALRPRGDEACAAGAHRGIEAPCPGPSCNSGGRWRSPHRPTRRCSTACRTRRRTSRYLARFTFPEFTSICPVTGQPDFGILVIDYVPKKWLVESKSLKLYLQSFRNHGAFHEDVTVAIGASRRRHSSSRTGSASAAISIRAAACPSTCSGRPAIRRKDVWLPDQGVPPYRGRG